MGLGVFDRHVSSRRGRARRLGLAAVAALAVGGFGTLRLEEARAGFSLPAVQAAVRLPGLPSLSTGIVDDGTFRDGTTDTRNVWLSRAQQIGSSSVRIAIDWANVVSSAPRRFFRASNPADRNYDFSLIDASVQAAVAHHQQVLLMVYHAPVWAEGPNRPSPQLVSPGSWYPSPKAFGAFAHAVALRYSGRFRDPRNRHAFLPRVRYFQAWNEPNLAGYLSPQYGRTTRGAYVLLSPVIYRAMLNAFYAAVKIVQPDSHVFAAGTAPFGDGPGQHTGRMSPGVFLQGLFCVTPALRRSACSGGPPHLDGLDHHIYSPPLYHAAIPGDIGIPDLNRIWRIVRAAQRLHTVLPAGQKSLWVTEVGWQSTPPDPVHLAEQAHYLALDLYEFWSQRVSRVFWFLIRDPVVPPGEFTANGGLYFMNGSPKPAAAAYRFPFVAVPAGHRRLTLWGTAPAVGTVVIQQHVGRGWKSILRLRTTSGGIFYSQIRLRGRPQLRATIGGSASPPWIAGF